MSHVADPLLGRFKNTSERKWHLIVVSSETMSGFQPRLWSEQVVEILRKEGNNGHVMCDEDGHVIKSEKIEAEYHK